MQKKGKILLFPCPIVEGNIETIPKQTIDDIHSTEYFAVERAKTARYYLKAVRHPKPISELNIHEISNDIKSNNEFYSKTLLGYNVGIISEAGCPGIADPGAEAVQWAHQNAVKVVPYVGPSSILLALMASGFSGQNFVFHGYLPNKKPELTQVLKKLETAAKATRQTQIFMEAPYRNQFLIENCLQVLGPNTRMCIATNINSLSESIIQQQIKDWKLVDLSVYHKSPTIFLLG